MHRPIIFRPLNGSVYHGEELRALLIGHTLFIYQIVAKVFERVGFRLDHLAQIVLRLGQTPLAPFLLRAIFHARRLPFLVAWQRVKDEDATQVTSFQFSLHCFFSVIVALMF
jgi:hypothetical protein